MSLGGSIIVQDEIQIDFLKKFRKFILKFLKKGYRFVIVTGGGKVCRKYQQAASKIVKITDEDKDWIGIHATRLNAQLVRTIFYKEACPVVLDNPNKDIANAKRYRLFLASGWRPGASTDYDTVLLAKRFGAKKIINASNIDYFYDKDPSRFKDARPIKDIVWKNYLKLVGSKWVPGMHVPFDPIASKIASGLKMTIIAASGADLKNMENIINNKPFKGTVIRP